jgi:hypothetical protein
VRYSLAVADMHRSKREAIFAGDAGVYPVFPEPGGALAWGRTSNALTMTWATAGEPSDWTVAIIDDASIHPEHWGYRGGVAQFLLDVVTGSVVVPWLEETGFESSPRPRFYPLVA